MVAARDIPAGSLILFEHVFEFERPESGKAAVDYDEVLRGRLQSTEGPVRTQTRTQITCVRTQGVASHIISG
jgi:hypothetical protein